ncbi:MAG: SRPBCC domain-containing protein [Bacteroidia bacterium]
MKNFKKYYVLNASPDEVYSALTNPLSIKLWTNEEAIMSTEPGTEFSIFGDSICGRNIEFEENKKIVQQWYFGEDSENSIVTIKLHPHKKGTSVEVDHINIPDEAYEDIVDGWDNIYFGNLEYFFD